jgi:hypothetical protein
MPEWIVSLISVSLGVILGVFFQDFLFKPTLEVEECDDNFYSPNDRCFHHRLRIKNTGLRAARDCMASVTLRGIVANDVQESHDRFGPEPVQLAILGPESFDENPRDISDASLHWAGRDNPPSMTINKQARPVLDVCYVSRAPFPPSVRIMICSELSRPDTVSLSPSRTYAGEIVITASNANHRRVLFELKPNGDDVDFVIKQVRPRQSKSWIRFLRPGQ